MVYMVSVENKPKVGEEVVGYILNDSRSFRSKQMVETSKLIMIRVNHIVDSKYAPNGFYVIGNKIKDQDAFINE
jgi:hypothetical protein